MLVKFNCPHCKRPVEANDDTSGSLIECPHCSSQIKVPDNMVFPCTTCNTLIKAPDSLAGVEGQCPQCGAAYTVPSPEGAVVGEEKMLDKAVCDVCLRKMQPGEGYVLTTRQVVTVPAYWRWLFENGPVPVSAMPRETAGKMLEQLIRQQCGQVTGWMTCERCITRFPHVDRNQAREYAAEFWRPEGEPKYSPPGGGPVDPYHALGAAEEAWKAVSGADAPETDIYAPVTVVEEKPETTEHANLKPGTEVPRSGTYKCTWCGPDGMLGMSMKTVSDVLPMALPKPALAQ